MGWSHLTSWQKKKKNVAIWTVPIFLTIDDQLDGIHLPDFEETKIKQRRSNKNIPKRVTEARKKPSLEVITERTSKSSERGNTSARKMKVKK